jgi:hypothetical protein
VATAAVPVVRDAFTPKNSNLIFSFQDANDHIVFVLASNTGVRPGSVGNPYLHIRQNLNYGLKFQGTDAVRVIEPGKSELIAMIRDARGIFADEDLDTSRNPCFVYLHSTDFAGKAAFNKTPADCNSLFNFERANTR